MSSVVEFDGIAGVAILAVPLVLVTVALLLSMMWPGRRPDTDSASSSPTEPAAEPQPGVSAPVAQPRLDSNVTSGGKPILTPYSFIPRARSNRTRDQHDTTSSEQLPPGMSPGSQPPPEQLDPASAKIQKFIDDALKLREKGDDTAAAESLRKAIINATELKKPILHAAARLELGDIAQAEGDMITACEHWQMARSMFEDEKRGREAATCEKKMLKNGCPTDWVLTDF
ncbi:MAG: hypothetical protein K0U74_10870 [Alphaproteobacteria bacterium]|nr:hypothetical protein [Alphaproteobacteria bacterium]